MEVLLDFFPEGLTFFSVSILIIASFFTSALTASVGVGGGLLMLALMTYIIPIVALIPVHGLVQLGSNIGRAYIQRMHIQWPIVWMFLSGSIFGAFIGAMLAVEMPASILKGLLGLFIFIIVWTKIPKLRNANPMFISLGGLATTFITMFAGATGPLVAAFLNSLFEEHRKMVATHGMTMTVQHSLKVLAFGFAGFAFWSWLPLVALIVVSGFFGSKAGTLLMDKLPETTFKVAFKIVMTLVAIDLIRRGFLNF